MIRLDVQTLHERPVDDVAVVIDVLRMTTTAGLLFAEGLAELWVVAAVEAARELAAGRGLLLMGERQGKALPGFHGGNSPLEYTRSVAGRGAVLCTSNGSRAVEFAGGARHLLLGAIVNARAVAARALELARSEISLICAGTGDRLSFDDVLGAACIARELMRLEPALELSDGALLALAALESSPDLHQGLKRARHGRLLEDIGFGDDLAFAAKLNSLAVAAERSGQSPARFVKAPSTGAPVTKAPATGAA
jgi:2-phosphosulfolactate phosphatase